MYKLTIIFTLSLILCVSSKIANFELENDANGISGFNNIGASYYKRLGLVNRRPLWILSLKDELTNLTLRSGSEEENDYFNYYAEPLLTSNQKLVRVKKDDPNTPKKISGAANEDKFQELPNDDADYSQNDVLELINKFILSVKLNFESDPYTITESDPSIELYFKGDYTLVKMSYANEIIQCLISPPSPLPAWFYEAHDTRSEVLEVPHTVKNEFYNTLLPFLQTVLAHPK